MPATSVTEQGQKEQVEDNLSNAEVKKEDAVDSSKLAALKAKSQAKQQ